MAVDKAILNRVLKRHMNRVHKWNKNHGYFYPKNYYLKSHKKTIRDVSRDMTRDVVELYRTSYRRVNTSKKVGA